MSDAARVPLRVHVELDVTPVWWSDTWVEDASEVAAALLGLKSVVGAVTNLDLGAGGVVLALLQPAQVTLEQVEAFRLQIWAELNNRARGVPARERLFALARKLAAPTPGADLPPPPYPRGVELYLQGAVQMQAPRKGRLWAGPRSS